MKFGKYLERHQVSEWRKKYVHYKLFKKQIKAVKRGILDDANLSLRKRAMSASSLKLHHHHHYHHHHPEQDIPDDVSGEVGGEHKDDNHGIAMQPMEKKKGANFEREKNKYDQMITEEFDKVNTFYKEREQEFLRQFHSIKDKLLSLKDQGMLDTKKKKPTSLSSSTPIETMTPNLIPKTPHSLTGSLQHHHHHHHHDSPLEKKLNTHLFRRSHRYTSSAPSNNATSFESGGASGGALNSAYSLPSYDPENQSPLSASSQPQNAAQKVLAHASKAETYWPKVKYTKVKRALKRALEENYREIEVLKEYVILNHTAFRKIFKKYDKVLHQSNSGQAMANVNSQYFVTSKILHALEHDIEKLYTESFKPGNRRDAMAKLRVQLNYHAPPRIIFLTGLLTGCAIMLFIFCVRYMIGSVSIFYFDEPYPIDFLSMFILFRCLALPIIMVWYFGILMYVCSIKKINHVFILGWDPRTHTNHYHILLLASALSFIWAVGLYLYVYLGTHTDGYMPVIFPFALLMTILLALFCPFNILNRSSRYWLIHTFARIFSAPFLSVKFKDFFFGDQLTSLAIVMSDFEYVVCYFVYDLWTHNGKCWAINPYMRPILVIIPPLLRALQSVRRYRDSKQNIHMMNFTKYSMSILSTIFSALAHSNISSHDASNITLTVLWILIASLSTFISCSWDFLMDWGILQTHSRNFLLRDHLLYRSKSVYYFAMVTNVIMRVSWAVNLSFESYSSRQKELIVLITAILEVTRRFQWNFFRLENEHLSNVGKFRAFDIRIPEVFSPLAAADGQVDSSTPIPTPTSSPSSTPIDATPIQTTPISPRKDTISINNNNNNDHGDHFVVDDNAKTSSQEEEKKEEEEEEVTKASSDNSSSDVPSYP